MNKAAQQKWREAFLAEFILTQVQAEAMVSDWLGRKAREASK